MKTFGLSPKEISLFSLWNVQWKRLLTIRPVHPSYVQRHLQNMPARKFHWRNPPQEGTEDSKENHAAHIATAMPYSEGSKLRAERDIGAQAATVLSPAYSNPEEVRSERKKFIEQIHAEFGSTQVPASRLTFEPPWIVEQAFTKDHESSLLHAD